MSTKLNLLNLYLYYRANMFFCKEDINLQGWTLKVIVSAVTGAFFLVNAGYCFGSVKINEFSSYDSSDWVELYSEEKVDISSFIIRDSATSIVKTIPDNTWIGSSSAYLVIEVSNRLNKGGDIIKLLQSDDSTIVDQISYGDEADVCAPNLNESSGRKPDGDDNLVRFSSQTKGGSNGNEENSCPSSSPSPSPTPSLSPTPTPTPTPSPDPSPIPSLIPTAQPTGMIPEGTESGLMLLASKSGEVKGVSEASEASKAARNKKPLVIAVVLIVLGLGLVAGTGVVFYKDQKYNGKDGKKKGDFKT